MAEAELTVRAARPDDAAVLVDWNAAMALETEGRELDRERLRRGVAGLFEDPRRGRYIVAERGGEVVGSLLVTYEWSDWRDADFFWIQSVYVRADARRSGVYRALHDEVRNLARADGACGIRLYVERDNTGAQTVYERVGMRASDYRLYEEDLV